MLLDPMGRLEFQEFLSEKMQEDRFGTRPNGTEAVSYTHLTLPTIYSV